jgi:AcrR family transcriptional regulator
VKNTPSQKVRNRTSNLKSPETRDRRVQRTKTSLHDALIGLAREKPYPSIAVKEILDRANVGRSTFYTHFRDKDDLLEGGIHDVLRSIHRRPRSGSTLDRVLAFSLPLLQHIDGHRRAAAPPIRREGRTIMHERLQDVLASVVADELETTKLDRSSEIPIGLVARHVASTFVLVLNWWIETDSAWTPADADARFRDLVVPPLSAFFRRVSD